MTTPNDNEERYLDEGTPPVDEGVAGYERLLAPYRYRPEPLNLPGDGPGHAGPEGRSEGPSEESRPYLVSPHVIQAVLAVAAVFVAVMLLVAEFSDTGGWVVRGVPGTELLSRGEWLSHEETAWIDVGQIGEVTVHPGSRVRLDDDGKENHALFLERGALDASIDARPREFQIGTPAGLSVDLGCVYRLEVDEKNVSRLEVSSGQVAFETEGRTVFVPEWYMTFARPGEGPVVPIPILSDPEFEAFVRRIERGRGVGAADLERVRALDDSVVLFHLLRAATGDTPGSQPVAEAAMEALLELEELPEGVSPEEMLSNEAAWLAWHRSRGLSWAPDAW